mmetsp:Transcript_24377/g.57175  ORF Transcript_24377/g.57175 Transcript_24377/m.57175 type:complete len:202 (+) Transcript_24377:255-860(+)
MHFCLLSISDKFKRQVQHSSTVTAIHQTSHDNASRHGSNEILEKVIVTNLAAAGVIHRHERFIISVLFVAVLVSQFSSMARVVGKHNVTRFTVSHDFAIGCQNIVSRRFRVLSVVHQNGNIFLWEPVDVLDVLDHIQCIIVAAPEFSLLSDIVDGNHHSPTCSTDMLGRHQIKRLVNVQRARTGELRNLAKSLGRQDFAHC